jgi:hypothetical protein
MEGWIRKRNVFYSSNGLAYFWRAKHKQQIVFYLYIYVPWEKQFKRRLKNIRLRIEKTGKDVKKFEAYRRLRSAIEIINDTSLDNFMSFLIHVSFLWHWSFRPANNFMIKYEKKLQCLNWNYFSRKTHLYLVPFLSLQCHSVLL